MTLKLFIIILSGIITILGYIPYIIDTIKNKTKPRIVTWFIWSLLNGISCIASFSEQQYSTAALMFCFALGTIAITVFGWKRGDKDINRLDIICLSGAIIGIILWAVLRSPSVAIIILILVDFIGGIPTLVHSWKKPDEETLTTYIMSFIGASLTLFTINSWRITSAAHPLFLVVICLNFILIITIRRRYLKLKKR